MRALWCSSATVPGYFDRPVWFWRHCCGYPQRPQGVVAVAVHSSHSAVSTPSSFGGCVEPGGCCVYTFEFLRLCVFISSWKLTPTVTRLVGGRKLHEAVRLLCLHLRAFIGCAAVVPAACCGLPVGDWDLGVCLAPHQFPTVSPVFVAKEAASNCDLGLRGQKASHVSLRSVPRRFCCLLGHFWPPLLHRHRCHQVSHKS